MTPAFSESSAAADSTPAVLVPAATATVAPPEGTPVPDAGNTSAPPANATHEQAVDEQWASQTAERSGIPQRALVAYAGATLRMREEFPDCGLDWATLAGIGWVESHHGTLHGGQILPSGQQEPPVVGIPLDGSRSLRIPDTDGGILDGDDVWDRAVGPMQFIPQTWSQYGADGNGDGIQDPQQIDDAALAAARYLCITGGDLTRSSGWLAAVGAYNPSVAYNNKVAHATDAYRGGGRP